MPRVADPFIVERNQKVVEAFQADPTQTYEELAAVCGVTSPGLVYSALRGAGLVGASNRRKLARRPDTAPVIAPELRQIGVEIERAVKEMSKTGASRLLQIGSAQKLTMVFRGQVDLTYTELTRCASFLSYESVEEMISKVKEVIRSNIYGKK